MNRYESPKAIKKTQLPERQQVAVTTTTCTNTRQNRFGCDMNGSPIRIYNRNESEEETFKDICRKPRKNRNAFERELDSLTRSSVDSRKASVESFKLFASPPRKANQYTFDSNGSPIRNLKKRTFEESFEALNLAPLKLESTESNYKFVSPVKMRTYTFDENKSPTRILNKFANEDFCELLLRAPKKDVSINQSPFQEIIASFSLLDVECVRELFTKKNNTENFNSPQKAGGKDVS